MFGVIVIIFQNSYPHPGVLATKKNPPLQIHAILHVWMPCFYLILRICQAVAWGRCKTCTRPERTALLAPLLLPSLLCKGRTLFSSQAECLETPCSGVCRFGPLAVLGRQRTLENNLRKVCSWLKLPIYSRSVVFTLWLTEGCIYSCLQPKELHFLPSFT